MANNSDFLPTACSTVNTKKSKRKVAASSIFEEQQSFFSTNSSQRKDSSLREVSFQLDKQKSLAEMSIQRANEVAAIPSKYLRANFSKSDTTTNMCNESTISESDLLRTPRNASTPRNSIQSESILCQSLAQISQKITDKNFSIDNLVDDFRKVINSDDQRSSIFKPGEEAASMLLAAELSWCRKNELPIQETQFSQIHDIEKESVGDFFNQGSETLPEFLRCKSPDMTREPVPLIESSNISITDKASPEDKKKKSLSISMIQRFLSDSNFTPKRAADNILKLTENLENIRLGDRDNINTSIQVSKDSSYTSDHSENNAIREICNKENVNSLNKTTSTHLLTSSRASSRSSSALSSLENGKLPIETTKCDLIWGCVKLGKSVTQEFIIRNRSAKKLVIQLTLSSQEFKIKKDNRSDSEFLNSNKILLHPQESKVVIISFSPTKIGAAVDDLYFTSLDQNLKQSRKQCIRLFGYGGAFKVDFSGLTRDTTGKFWLSLGRLDDRNVIKSVFNVKNRGDVPIFIYISLQSMDACKLDINPNFFILMPQIQKEITISYRPSNEDYIFVHRSLHNPVIDLGNLNVTFGTEVDRGRLRKICEKLVESGFKIDALASVLTEKVSGEVMPLDLIKFKESPTQIKEIMKLFNHHQIVVTLERDPEQTLFQQFSDDSYLYQSLHQDTTLVMNKTGMQNSCYVAPSIIVLTLPYKYKDNVYLKSENDQKLNFRINSHSELEIKPKEGSIEPHGTVTISVKYHSNTAISEKKSLKLMIIIENEIFEVDIKVDSLGHGRNKNKSILNCL